MNYPVKHYNTGTKKSELVALILAIALLIAMICLNLFVEEHTEPDLVMPMANQRIEWSGAGYNGIYGR